MGMLVIRAERSKPFSAIVELFKEGFNAAHEVKENPSCTPKF